MLKALVTLLWGGSAWRAPYPCMTSKNGSFSNVTVFDWGCMVIQHAYGLLLGALHGTAWEKDVTD